MTMSSSSENTSSLCEWIVCLDSVGTTGQCFSTQPTMSSEYSVVTRNAEKHVATFYAAYRPARTESR